MSPVQAKLGSYPIRTQLNLLVLAAVVPLFLAFAYDVYHEARTGFERAQAEALRLSLVASADAQGYFARTEQRLGDISRRVEMGNLDPARCKALFADSETIRREYAGLAMVDRDGRMACLAGDETEQSIEGLTAARLMLALAEGHPRLHVGAPVRGKTMGDWTLPLAYPVRGGDGSAAGMVIAAAQLDRFQSLVAALQLPEKPISLIVKGDGLVVASSHDRDRNVGQSRRSDTLTQAIIGLRSEGVLRGKSVDGVERIYGFHPVAGTDWTAIVGIDIDPIREEVIANALTRSAYGLGVLALALGFSFAMGRRIATPIAAVSRAAFSFGEGRREVRAPVAGAREVAEVAVQLNRMFDILEERERSLIATQKMLDSLLESMDRVLWSFSPDMKSLTFVSESSKKLFGHEASTPTPGSGLKWCIRKIEGRPKK